MLSVCLQQEYVHLLLSCKPAAKPSICMLLFHFAACLFSFPSLLLYICSALSKSATANSQYQLSISVCMLLVLEVCYCRMSVCCWC